MLSATDLAYRVSKRAETEARLLGWRQIVPEHILLALLAEDDNNLIRRVLNDNGVTPEEVREAVKAVVPQGDLLPHETSKPILILNSGIAAVERADEERAQLGHKLASNGHILLGLLNTATAAKTVLNNLGIHYNPIREYLRPILDEMDEEEARITEQLCGKCGVNPVSEDPEDVLKVDGESLRVCPTCW